MSSIAIGDFATQTRKGIQMSKAEDNKAIVGRWKQATIAEELESGHRRAPDCPLLGLFRCQAGA
jgi:hypothetical protein